jgi:hypothetical protein
MARLAARPPADGGGRTAAWWPWSIVAAAVGWNLASLRALTLGVAYLNDSSLHEQMVRFATVLLRAGHLPLTSWFPFLGEGSPQFLHYQSLPAIVTGLAGLAVGPDVAFRWSLYLLLSLWPISVYLSARAFGAGRPAAAASAAMAPFLVSATGVGYEQHAYMWTGFGVWTQLWASWTLPLAWGRSWRAIRDGRGYLAAVLLTALTVALQTASLMTDPEYYFDQRNPGDYRLFGIRYLIIATGSRPPVPARLRLRAGPYSLWTLPGAGGVLHAGTIVGHLTANRTDIGTRTLPVLHSDLAQHERYEQVRFDQPGSGVPARSSRSSTVPPPRRSAGAVVAQADRLTAGRTAATVAMHRRGVVVLSASFDPGWTATVDGRSQPT